MIEFKNLSLSFENKELLINTDLDLEENQLNVILGSNGSGKTTLLRHLVYQHLPQSNINWIYQPQGVYLFKKKVKDNFCDHNIGKRILEEFNALTLYEQDIKTLSGGEKQIVSLARTFSYPADLYILDEPTAHLDTAIRHKVYEILKTDFKDKTILLVSHDSKIYFDSACKFNIVNKEIKKTKGAR